MEDEDKLWSAFEEALANNNTSFEAIKGETNDEAIKEMIRACDLGINDFQQSELFSKFKNKQSMFSLSLFELLDLFFWKFVSVNFLLRDTL
jgi:hypothetical protein